LETEIIDSYDEFVFVRHFKEPRAEEIEGDTSGFAWSIETWTTYFT
jgi:hypothetical protein